MQYRTDKKSDTKLSALGIGCMRLPRRGVSIDMKASERLIVHAIEQGVNFFDTAYIYPGSEAALGEILHKNNLREKVYISTKLPHSQCKKYDDFDKLFNIEKDRLNTDYIDYYLIHNIVETGDWARLISLGIEDWISKKKKSGELKRIGFSFHGNQQDFLTLIDMYDWDFCMIQYNYMDENYQAGSVGLKKAHSKGMPVIIMEPLLGGKLATGLPQKAKLLLENTESSRTPAEWAIMWLLNQEEVTVVLSGMNSIEQLDENVSTASKWQAGSLSETELDVIKSVKNIIEETYKVKCTGCNYCVPCPRKVNIPDSLSSLNMSYAMGYITGLKSYVMSTSALRSSDNQLASNCNGCGVCLKKCPQHINIIEALGQVKKRLEPFWVSLLLKAARKILG